MNLPLAAGIRRIFMRQAALRLLLLVSVPGFSPALPVGAAAEETTSNLAVMQELARAIGRELASRIPGGDSVTVAAGFAPEALAWVVQGPVRQALAAHPARLVVGGAQYGVECSVTNLSVRYENSRRGWFLGGRQVDRIVDVALDGTVTDRRSGVITATGTFSRTSRDTVAVSAVPSLEDQGVSFTHASLPGESFFSWAAEPLIMIGAIGVSIYLLFHVRS